MQKQLVRDYMLEFMETELPSGSVSREMEVRPRKDLINTITGPRRAGKSFYFYQKIHDLGKERSLYLNFEDSRLIDVDFREFRELINMYSELSGSSPEYIFMDEVQNIDGWEHGVRDIYERQQYRIFLTGSSSKLLSREISTHLRGRAIGYLLLPFSFSEFLSAKGFRVGELTSRERESRIRNLLIEYLRYGGFPQIVFEDELKDRLLHEFAETMLYRDVVERHGIKSISLARMLLNHLVSAYGKEMSVNRLYNTLKSRGMRVGKDTVYEYTSYFLDSMSVFFLNRYSEKPRLREGWPKKVYLCDTGFARILGKRTDMGRSMENAVFLQLKRMQNTEGMEIFYYYNGGEVDFLVVREDGTKHLIQVTYEMEEPDVRKREIFSLIKAGRKLGASMEIVTWDEEGIEKTEYGDIDIVPLWKFLLRKRTDED